MTSQIRVDEITNRSGLGTVTIYDNGFEFTGVTTFTENVDIEGSLTIGGVLTYEDTTNIDSVGVITARAGVNISGGNLQVGGTTVINSGLALYNLEQIKLADTKELVLGSGNDLKIHHSGSHSFISQEGVGALKIKGDDIRFEDAGGTEALRIDDVGRLLIGRTSALASSAERLTIDDGMAMFRRSSTNAAALYIRNEDSTADTRQPYLIFTDGGGNRGGFGVQYNESSLWISGQNGIAFRTGGTAPSTTERLRITSAGKVGIGTDIPSNFLHVKNYTNASNYITAENTTAGNAGVRLKNSQGDYAIFANDDLIFYDLENDVERLRITSAGNMGLGVTPIAPGYTTLHIGESSSGQPVRLQMSTANTGATAGDGFTLSIDGSSSGVNLIQRENAPIQFYTNNSERMRIFGSGACLQINTTTTPTSGGFQLPQISIKQVASNWTGGIHIESSSSTKMGCIASTEDGLELSQSYRSGTGYGSILFRTSGTLRAKLLSNGFFQMGSGYLNSTAYHRFNGINASGGDAIFVVSGYQNSGGTNQDSLVVNASSDSAQPNSATSTIRVFRHASNQRSINAAGSVNASGNDYAEYMTKSGNFTLAKGDVCGVNTEGKLTNVFADAISFVVKSTDPSYVGGDKWHEVAGEQPGGYDDTRTEEEIAAAKVVYEEALESARQLVDRIAFSGQVPVNVTGATPGQHIIPTAASDGSIEGTAKAEADLTMAEYMSSVGKVIAIEDDGRPRIIVKVA